MYNTSQFHFSAIRIVVIRRHHSNHISWGKNDEWWPFPSLHIFLPVDNRMTTIPMMNFYNVCVLVLDWNSKRPIRYGNSKRTLRMLVIVADMVAAAIVPVPVPTTPSKRVMQMKWNETKWIDAVLRQRQRLGNSARERERERLYPLIN